MTTNLEILRPSRVRPKVGDVFALRLGGLFRFGRVISTEAMAGWNMPGANLIYVFTYAATEADVPDRAELTTARLLVSPIMTNRLPWSRGYFQTLINLPIEAGEALPRHCFRSSAGRFYDEWTNELEGPIEPVGDWGMGSFRTIDDDVSSAVGLPLAPD
jgi:Immunity protein 26